MMKMSVVTSGDDTVMRVGQFRHNVELSVWLQLKEIVELNAKTNSLEGSWTLEKDMMSKELTQNDVWKKSTLYAKLQLILNGSL